MSTLLVKVGNAGLCFCDPRQVGSIDMRIFAIFNQVTRAEQARLLESPAME